MQILPKLKPKIVLYPYSFKDSFLPSFSRANFDIFFALRLGRNSVVTDCKFKKII